MEEECGSYLNHKLHYKSFQKSSPFKMFCLLDFVQVVNICTHFFLTTPRAHLVILLKLLRSDFLKFLDLNTLLNDLLLELLLNMVSLEIEQ